MSERLPYFVPCAAGAESILADELRALGLRGVRPQRSGVLMAGSVGDGLRAVLWSRYASRVLLTLGEVDASTADALYESVRAIAWEDHMRASGTLAVDAAGVNEALRNTQFTAVRVKDGIVDRFRDRFHTRPSVDVKAPDLRVNVAVRGNRATISIDLAGQPLHRRGYREPGVQVEAPMKETLAASMLALAGWPQIAARGGTLIDPMCGSGTLAIEAGLMACDVAPGLLRDDHPVKRWLGFDERAWDRIVHQAQERRDQGRSWSGTIIASDHDARAITIARRCVARAGLEGLIAVRQAELSTLAAPREDACGLIITNPPWGERLGAAQDVPAVHAMLSSRISQGFAGYRLAVVSPDERLARDLRLRPEFERTVGSGKGAARLSVFALGDASEATAGGGAATGANPAVAKKSRADRSPAAAGNAHAVDAAPAADLAPQATEFANRLAKMARHYAKWARRTGVTCYRIYDADLPEFAVAVDLYAGTGADAGARWAYVAEYAPPRNVDADRAAARLDWASEAVARVLEIPPSSVFAKRRERQRGSAQYGKHGTAGAIARVAEDGLTFEVNFSDYLDTGLFLDHRNTRARIRELAAEKRFLNLFAYTGAASVHAAAGGARSTTTVDLSQTYLDWAARNMGGNGFVGPEHLRERADSFEWLRQAAEAGSVYDLVFCDPPTFSNSKRMSGTFDVQRDHTALLRAIKKVLAPDGLIVFSCNRKGFVLDDEGLSESRLVAQDITAATIPKDFERTPKVHVCFEVRRA